MRSRQGFTLAELALVMGIVLVLAAVAIPVGLRANREGKEAKLLAVLKELRTAVSCFVSDCGGYPEQLADVMSDTPPANCRSTSDGSQMSVDPADFRGPYLIPADGQMPKDPITHLRQWSYNPQTGRIKSMAPGKNLEGTPFDEL
ncbi:MAG: prepilin-type N-terminal cleavage/methylation domain-containing protein [Armatimonadota bacterium]